MFFRAMMFVWEFVLDLVMVMRMTEDAKDLEIMLLRQQLRIVERKQKRGPQIPRWRKVPLAVLTTRLKDKATNAWTTLSESVRLFKPETVIGWHRDLVRRKWTFKQGKKPGRPSIDSELEDWILQVAHDNPGLGFEKLEEVMRHPVAGALWESHVVMQVARHYLSQGKRVPLWFWRTVHGAEVDLLIERAGQFIAIEAKMAEQPDKKALKGIHALRKFYGDQSLIKGYIASRTKQAYPLSDNIQAVPGSLIHDFLSPRHSSPLPDS